MFIMPASTQPEKIYLGFDVSGDRNVEYTHEWFRYLTLVAVNCSDLKDAERIADWLEQNWPGKNRKRL